ncbi:MDR family oxidoreductase [Deinococcus peraridilitoris]|uniref:Putative quinone oxidoreductase, YhdH/YhfP family n=1 Tax=Deinococcus peraridilitoris (strain DSM 19664 / LMG 22246 / CIP 109416 / KR-200) TaxID=937777 RepID=L0A1E2_DEIPD|nr:MDR family oxidoreductase [Deinococcus peraridilitoris]AFZ66835.1 putative quinone oxidoreductase, YhdH/YhfP family [Deinococcus peraridilitoris DSM 19664]
MTTAVPDAFRALILSQQDGTVQASLRDDLPTSELPEGDVLVAVEASSLNYKDGLAVLGRPGVVRSYPMVPGIDLAGTVLESSDERHQQGERVLVTGWGMGERHWGGYAELARVPADWLIRIPERFSARDAMAVGTAGLTAMLCVMALEERGLTPGAGEVVVTGAAGGVGSVAVALLAARGYTVVASTGRAQEQDYLRRLGAHTVIGREELLARRPLERERWAGAVDSVGGDVLAGVLASLRYGASATACGLARSSELPTSVLPFILRGASLLGIDSVMCPAEKRQEAWHRLAGELPGVLLQEGVTEQPLSEVPRLAREILEGRVRGRTVILPRA